MNDDAIRDMFESAGPVIIRRMFGGKGIYVRGAIVALEVGGEVLLKADDDTAPLFRAAGASQWTYRRRNGDRTAAMPYWSIPDAALDDPEELSKWVRLACEAGIRAAKRSDSRKSKPGDPAHTRVKPES